MKSDYTLIGTLPPIKGISPYITSLIAEIEKRRPILFLGFKSIYPSILYPGGAMSKEAHIPIFHNTVVWNGITWYNPLTWFLCGFKCRGQVEIHYWTPFISHILIVIILICKLKGNKLIMVVHNVLPHGNASRTKRFLHTAIYYFIDDFIVHNEISKNLLLSIKPRTSIRIRKHPDLLVQTDCISPEKSIVNLKSDYGLSKFSYIYLHFGTVRKYKNLENVVNFFKSSSKNDSALLIAGKFWEPVSRYRKMVADLGISNQVFILDRFIEDDEVGKLFLICDELLIGYSNNTGFESGVLNIARSFEKKITYCGSGYEQ